MGGLILARMKKEEERKKKKEKRKKEKERSDGLPLHHVSCLLNVPPSILPFRIVKRNQKVCP